MPLVTGFWPDPASGLMWANAQNRSYVNQTKAVAFCDSLHTAGFSDWRLPTFAEAQSGMTPQSFQAADGSTDTVLVMKGGIYTLQGVVFWTSTPAGPGKAQTFTTGSRSPVLVSSLVASVDRSFGFGALCVRTMEPELEKLATDAAVQTSVPDITTLKASVPLHQAHLAYLAGNFQDVIPAAQAALALKPDFDQAFFALGLAYGLTGRWDDAVQNFDNALKVNKQNGSAKEGKAWAQRNLASKPDPKHNTPPAWE